MFADDLWETFGGRDDPEAQSTMRDLARHGAEGGFPGLTYYSDTSKLYDAHEDEIWEALSNDAEEMGSDSPLSLIASFGGASNVYNDSQFRNLLVWYMAERVAREDDNE